MDNRNDNPVTLETLPKEILEIILSYIPAGGTIHANELSTRIQGALNNENFWRDKMLKEHFGCTDEMIKKLQEKFPQAGDSYRRLFVEIMKTTKTNYLLATHDTALKDLYGNLNLVMFQDPEFVNTLRKFNSLDEAKKNMTLPKPPRSFMGGGEDPAQLLALSISIPPHQIGAVALDPSHNNILRHGNITLHYAGGTKNFRFENEIFTEVKNTNPTRKP